MDTVYTDGVIDNGSGVAALLEVARQLADGHFEHDIYFVFVDGKEIGLFGSQAYAKDHADEISDAVANINMDSVGSGSDSGLTVGVGLRYPEAWSDMWWGYQQVSTPEVDDLVSDVVLDVLGFAPELFRPEDISGGRAGFASFAAEDIPTTDMMWLDLDKVATRPGQIGRHQQGMCSGRQ